MEVQEGFSGVPRFSVSVSNGSVMVVPLPQGQGTEASQLHQIPTHVLNEQLAGPPGAAASGGHVTTLALPQTISTVTEYFPGHTHQQVSSASSVDSFTLSSADEGLADLQPEDSDGEDDVSSGAKAQLTQDQKKLEFMAALNLVPPAVLEEIRRRQQLCRAEYGNWWDRLHSTDFCLVAKSDSALTNLQSLAELSQVAAAAEYPPVIPAEDQTHVATGPDADSLVEQITYLTSWPQPTTSQPSTTVEVMTSQHPAPAPPPAAGPSANQLGGSAHIAGEEQPLHVTLTHINSFQ